MMKKVNLLKLFTKLQQMKHVNILKLSDNFYTNDWQSALKTLENLHLEKRKFVRTRPPLGPSLRFSMTSVIVIRSDISMSGLNGNTSLAGSRLTTATCGKKVQKAHFVNSSMSYTAEKVAKKYFYLMINKN